MPLALLVLARVVANPFSNVFQKLLTNRGADPFFVILATHALITAGCLPFLIARPPANLPGSFWVDMSVVAVLTVAGNALLVQAVRHADLSLLGPINAYKSVIGLIPGLILLGEVPGLLGLAGIGLIVAGSYVIVDRPPASSDQPRRRRKALARLLTERGVQYRFAAMALAAVEAAFGKRALLASSPFLAFAGWAILGLVAAAVVTPLLLRRTFRPQLALARANAPTTLALAATTTAMQLCTVYVLAGLQVGYALALFQTSTLLTVLLGWRVFDERDIRRRLVGSVIMIAGATLIILGR
jgi:drug/metabolite transporter (DMT)-like permease